jgi:hypothetical protein
MTQEPTKLVAELYHKITLTGLPGKIGFSDVPGPFSGEAVFSSGDVERIEFPSKTEAVIFYRDAQPVEKTEPKPTREVEVDASMYRGMAVALDNPEPVKIVVSDNGNGEED